jgi:hypothetical protein
VITSADRTLPLAPMAVADFRERLLTLLEDQGIRGRMHDLPDPWRRPRFQGLV